MEFEGDEVRKHSGRAQPKLTKMDILGTGKTTPDGNGDIHILPHDTRARQLHGQIARLQQWTARLRRLRIEPGQVGYAMLMLQLNTETVKNICSNLDHTDDIDVKLFEYIQMGQPNDVHLYDDLTILLKT